MMGHSEIPGLYPVTRQVITAQDALRDRIIKLEDALRGVVGQIDLLHYSGRLDHDPRTNHRYIAAVEALR